MGSNQLLVTNNPWDGIALREDIPKNLNLPSGAGLLGGGQRPCTELSTSVTYAIVNPIADSAACSECHRE